MWSWWSITVLIVFVAAAILIAWAVCHPRKVAKLLGLIKFLIIVGFITSCVGQDEDGFIVTKDHPIVTPAAEIADLDIRTHPNGADYDTWWANIMAFLGNDSLNLSNETGLFYA